MMFGLGKEKITLEDFTKYLMNTVFNEVTIKDEVNEFIIQAKAFQYDLDRGFDFIKRHWIAIKAVQVLTLITDDDVSIRVSLKNKLIPEIESRFKVSFNHMRDINDEQGGELTDFNMYDGHMQKGLLHLDWSHFFSNLKEYIPDNQIEAYEDEMKKEVANLESGIKDTTDNSGSNLVFIFKTWRSKQGKNIRSIKDQKKIIFK